MIVKLPKPHIFSPRPQCAQSSAQWGRRGSGRVWWTHGAGQAGDGTPAETEHGRVDRGRGRGGGPTSQARTVSRGRAAPLLQDDQ